MSPPSRLQRFGEAGPLSQGRRFVEARGARILVVALVITVLAGAGRTLLRVSHGLSAEYFTNVDRNGVAALTGVDPDASTSALARRWGSGPPETFSARWRGYLPDSALDER
jgi:hypothetical protein